jgi:hypothetical protein
VAAVAEQRGERRPDRLAGHRAPRGLAGQNRAIPPHHPDGGAAARLLGLLALLLPACDRERFVGEVLADIAGLRWRQRLDELLSVAGAVPGLAVIVRWARRRRA